MVTKVEWVKANVLVSLDLLKTVLGIVVSVDGFELDCAATDNGDSTMSLVVRMDRVLSRAVD